MISFDANFVEQNLILICTKGGDARDDNVENRPPAPLRVHKHKAKVVTPLGTPTPLLSASVDEDFASIDNSCTKVMIV